MTALDPRRAAEPVLFSEYGIPVRNLWHMLLYAWEEVPLRALRGWKLVDVDQAPGLDALLARMLVHLMQGRLRTGLGRDYVNEADAIQSIRGRIDFAESLRRRTFERGEAYCEFQEYSVDEPRNQIIRTTLARLAQVGQFGPRSEAARELQHRLRRLVRDLDCIDLIELHPELIRRQLQGRNDRDYRLMLAICQLILQRQMPGETKGRQGFAAPDHDALVLHSVYERFVANFYRIHLRGWTVSPQKRLEWHAKSANEHLPSMIPDLVLQEEASGRIVVLDTKFTPRSLIENQWDKPIYDPSHLYQLYAYLRSQEHLSEAHHTASGVLLYPAVQASLSERIELQEHLIRVECLDLRLSWQEIEAALLELIVRKL